MSGGDLLRAVREPLPPIVACAVALRTALDPRDRRRGGPIREICLIRVPGGGRRPVRTLRWERIASLMADAEAVFTDPGREAAPLLAGLARRGMPGPLRVRSLRGAVRALAGIGGAGGAAAVAERLGAFYREEESAEAAAANIAAILEKALERHRSRREEKREGAAALTPEFLAGVPPVPGIYRFLDEEGRLLYVGKAANLRRRLASHAAAAASGRRSAGRPMELSIHNARRVEITPLGSDLEAILAEARILATRRSHANVQRRLRDRGRRYAPHRFQALLLPSPDPGAATVLLVRDGRYAGLSRIGPRGGGIRKIESLVSGFFGEGPGISPGDRSPGEGGEDPRSEILARWLGRYGDRFSRVDLDSFAGAAEAVMAIREGARAVARGGVEVEHRRSSGG